MTPAVRLQMLLVALAPATQPRVLEVPRYEFDSERGATLGCLRAVLWGLVFEAVMILCGLLCWMLIRHW
jgi:hypothetical protein